MEIESFRPFSYQGSINPVVVFSTIPSVLVCVCVYVCVYVCAYIDACNVYSTGSDRFSLIIQARQPRGSSRSSRPFFQHLSFFPQLRPLILFHSSNQRRKPSDPDGRLNHTHCLRSCFLPHSSFGFESGRSSSFFFVFYFIFSHPVLSIRFPTIIFHFFL